MTKLVTPAEEAAIRSYAETVLKHGSRGASRATKAEVRRTVHMAHLKAAAQAVREGRSADADTHIAWVHRVSRR